MSGLVDIYNRALSACGSEIGITDPTENSREAALCRLWYPQVRDNVQAAAPWDSCKRQSRLAQITQRGAGDWSETQPDSRYMFAYALPSNMLQPLYLDDYQPFTMSVISGQRALSCNNDRPILSYLIRIDDTALWSPELTRAVVHSLATMIALPLTGSASRLQQNAQLAFGIVEEAKAQAANAQHTPEENLPDWLSARGYANPQIGRFYYPLATLSLGTTA